MLTRAFQRIPRQHDAELIIFFINDADFTNANTIVGAKRSANPDPPGTPTDAG